METFYFILGFAITIAVIVAAEKSIDLKKNSKEA